MASFRVIQGGMGVGVSGWRLARAVSLEGELGVVSGSGIAVVMARRLQKGDEGGHVRRALGAFPDRDKARWAVEQYFVEGGKREEASFKSVPLPQVPLPEGLRDLTVMGAFVEVWLAKEGHGGVVGINLLEKVQTLTLATLLGAMMAGVDYVLMGAGIPRQIPGVLDAMARGGVARLKLDVEGAGGAGEAEFWMEIEPGVYGVKDLRRPGFLAIVSSHTLAATLARKSNGRVDGFIIEAPKAGGHNAPPRGTVTLTADGQPVYGERDRVDLEKMKEIGLPFYLAGGCGKAGKLAEALALGAAGIQVGTAFAFCRESGITGELKREVIRLSREGKVKVYTDRLASPTGFPFKVVEVEGTYWERGEEAGRERVCDLGMLRKLCVDSDGTLRYRCAAEPVEVYVGKGGTAEDAVGRKCLCNALFSTVGLGQVRANGYREPAVVTAGDDAVMVAEFCKLGAEEYSAAEVLAVLRG